MKLEINEREIMAEAIAKLLPASRVESVFAKMMERVTLLSASEARARLGIGMDKFRALKLPAVNMGERAQRYRLTDIEALIERRTT